MIWPPEKLADLEWMICTWFGLSTRLKLQWPVNICAARVTVGNKGKIPQLIFDAESHCNRQRGGDHFIKPGLRYLGDRQIAIFRTTDCVQSQPMPLVATNQPQQKRAFLAPKANGLTDDILGSKIFVGDPRS